MPEPVARQTDALLARGVLAGPLYIALTAIQALTRARSPTLALPCLRGHARVGRVAGLGEVSLERARPRRIAG
jgi:hypothetical protein